MKRKYKFNLPEDRERTVDKMMKAVDYFIDIDDLCYLIRDKLIDLTVGYLSGDRYLTDHISYLDHDEVFYVKDNETILLQWSGCDEYTQIVFESCHYTTEVIVEITHFNPDAYTFNDSMFLSWTKYEGVE